LRGKKIFIPKEFHKFSLDKAVPKNHLLRSLDSILDLGFIDQMTEGLYGYNGNKSVDPVVVIKVLLLGFLYNIGSVRETMHPQSGLDVGKRNFRASGKVCASCKMRSRCTTGKGPRTIYRHADENYADQALAKCNTSQFHHNMGRRMAVVEGSFGNGKEHCAHRRSRWRGLTKMQIQCYLAGTAQNLKKLVNYGWKTTNSGINQAITLIFDLFIVILSLSGNAWGTIRDYNTGNNQLLNFYTSNNNMKLDNIW